MKEAPEDGSPAASGYVHEVPADMPIVPSESFMEESFRPVEGFELRASFTEEKRFMLFYGGKDLPLHAIAWDEKIEMIRDGISKADLMYLKDGYNFTLDDLSRILDITPRTIQGKLPSDRFTGNVGEKILALGELYSYGIEVFEEEQKFKRWLNTPNPVLKNHKPVDLLTTMVGMKEIKNELGRIDYGVY
ncbi:MbcA/ParS/Xre antitoxin family protein [Paraflavisolibacter sp. H34]|uniref:MbcA/ParS/Xre antitoxin family protein n=1 Tax=Huijunlia imazamoxiresistens TaxID=3127457 RepID=UPI003015B251